LFGVICDPSNVWFSRVPGQYNSAIGWVICLGFTSSPAVNLDMTLYTHTPHIIFKT